MGCVKRRHSAAHGPRDKVFGSKGVDTTCEEIFRFQLLQVISEPRNSSVWQTPLHPLAIPRLSRVLAGTPWSKTSGVLQTVEELDVKRSLVSSKQAHWDAEVGQASHHRVSSGRSVHGPRSFVLCLKPLVRLQR